ARGYRFLTMAAFADALAAGHDLTATCALTFDDGTEDHLTVLAPLLTELGVPGTVYVCPGLFGTDYPWGGSTRFMTEEEVLELAR
ncbi:polysaccharide deacetylase family protein, partial [Escherichia coli]